MSQGGQQQGDFSSKSFSLLTYNVNFSICKIRNGQLKARSSACKVLQALKEVLPDAIALQETNEGWEALWSGDDFLSGSYQGVWHHRGAAGGQAFLLKKENGWQITDHRMVNTRRHVEGSWFEQLTVLLTRTAPPPVVSSEKQNSLPHSTSDTQIRIVCVHLRPPKGWMAATSQTRADELEYTLQNWNVDETQGTESTDMGRPALVCGDFNECEGYKALALLQSKYGLRNGLAEHDPQKETMSVDVPLLWGLFTWHRTFRLDHIFYSPLQLSCDECRVVRGYEEGASDHQPVVGVFTLNQISSPT
uniref:Endonuclease/exonuclease/phosphatase domain-containing protein n=1 Tax=Chromera velia CCMP2878 TaxID=1169474 RepID=A0A0G4F4D8_9ALVE|eukprot:Cvel_15010.t1-p1 / transcript=Cvel_15010.t1 / gene=Cvel_15010 / organism=Chromera_velia_CCMP2878 / gene_product=hypothetical protein / transcript_product=hypothetical protein / location=Cvel_scaffold1092:38443-39354(+) / protein_length=304 / sequence_SO=supercontig / SO=protein_coding / is_pseudo=false